MVQNVRCVSGRRDVKSLSDTAELRSFHGLLRRVQEIVRDRDSGIREVRSRRGAAEMGKSSVR